MPTTTLSTYLPFYPTYVPTVAHSKALTQLHPRTYLPTYLPTYLGPSTLDFARQGFSTLVDRRYDADNRGVPIRPIVHDDA